MSEDPTDILGNDRLSHGELIARIAEATAEARATQGAVKAQGESIQRQLNLLTGLPMKVAALSEQVKAVTNRVQDLERHNNRTANRIVQWIGVGVAVIVGCGSMIIGVIQLAHG